MPQNCSGRLSPLASFVIEMVEVLEARIAFLRMIDSVSDSTAFFTLSFSTTASTTKSASAIFSYESVGVISVKI